MGNSRIGLVLSGGGANGDFQAGVCHKLLERNVKINQIATCSVGNANGLMMSIGNPDIIKKEWYSGIEKKVLDGNTTLGTLATLAGRKGIYSHEGLVKLLSKYKDYELNIPIRCQTLSFTNMALWTYNIHTKLRKEDIDTLVQGMLMPYAWEPLDEKFDAGLVNPVPYNLLNARNFDKIIVVENYPPLHLSQDWGVNGPFKGLKYLIRANQIASYYLRHAQMKKIRNNPKYIIVQPDHVTGDFIDFSLESIDYGFKLGLKYANKLIEENEF